jgi:hypothetical protein
VSVRLEVEGSRTPLYPDPRGSGRFYLEAREGARYEIRLDNRTGERLGVVVTVDGLNVISGERSDGRGRMYILDPWGTTQVRGWRSSLSDVRRFTFVDEKASYAARSGKANGRLGWIEVNVFRERGRPRVCCDGRDWPGGPYPLEPGREEERGRDTFDEAEAGRPGARAEAPSPHATPPPPSAATPPPPVDDRDPDASGEAKSKDGLSAEDSGALSRRPPPRPDRPRSFPGTGWGPRVEDRVVVVDFQPEPVPAEQLTLRYEYASALRALGIRVWPDAASDRLRDRERGALGFARPPAR